MTWREQVICRILCIMARMLAGEDIELQKELRSLQTHIQIVRTNDD